ncbi:MAG: hypothetical protein A2Y28_05145 [Chlamydiae bacterium GWC2_50_10]|nr:MAG: hypothetical protein A2Z85_02320 [Chlamydiae bacterium GWA2_50_15]OGN54343.1 MAG: hypothetical protein A2Y28_05145 [Chlamydiae bacterium GWC2_50_10]OGN54846.1 MAG: hypothetical protein A2098_04050 [Chlamydiae bacterium GWF2_49_8]OGN59012.1 MAG: hypothetical protein A3D18_02420 [Chlamydiae bacterium RIFCSPHIGHO2_02_FULL_49_29]OGN62831.1 MAG: hypothetical protein A3E26_03370 [Chlamydiae bacterium RIFCSPHIGHO2_12_FULL_49_32]OGN75234.1 MAG: hypothetical protein A3G30_05360 [Chlamydiae bact
MTEISMEAIRLFQRSRFFRGLTERQMRELIPLVRKIQFDAGDYIVHEGDLANDLFVILEGEVDVIKKEPSSEQRHRLTKLTQEDIFGEMSLIEQGTHSATVRAVKPTTLLALSINEARMLSSEKSNYERLRQKMRGIIEEIDFLSREQPTYFKLSTNLATELSLRLRQANEVTVDSLKGQLHEARSRVAMGSFMINVLTMLVLYVFSLKAISTFGEEGLSTAIISVPLIVLFACGLIVMMKSHGYPLSFYGLTRKNWKRSAFEGVLISIPLIALCTLIKWFLITFIEGFEGVRLFSFTLGINSDYLGKVPLFVIVILPLIYLLFTPLQELISRGALQSSLEEFLVGAHKQWWAILLSNLLFSVTHLHVSFEMALAVFIPGLAWGWLYSRQRSLVGVSVSHMVVGSFAFYILGVQGVLTVNP